MANSQTCHLLALPAELRTEVYRLAFADATAVISRGRNGVAKVTSSAGLLLANKQVHAETRSLFHASTDFTAMSPAAFTTWVAKLDPKVRVVVRSVCVRVYISDRTDVGELERALLLDRERTLVVRRVIQNLRGIGIGFEHIRRFRPEFEMWSSATGKQLYGVPEYTKE